MSVEPDMDASVVVECRDTRALEGRVTRRHELDHRTREAMFRLLTGHFAGVDRVTFESDLADKQCVILLEDDTGSLRGFSTMALYSTDAPGRRISVVYSGDTIVEREWWGSPALARTWIRAVRQLVASSAAPELYWLLLTSGFRTYRFLPVFFRAFHPRYDEPEPQPPAALLDAIVKERFGDRYDAGRGIVRFARPQVLAPDLLELPAGRTLDPHIAYFLRRNPGHVRGDELACLTSISDANLTAAGRRMTHGAGEHDR